MATHNDHKNLQPEDSGIKARPVLMFLVILAVATAITFVIVWGVLYGLQKWEAMNKPQPVTDLPAGQARRFPPEPRLQGAPAPLLPGETGDKKSLLPEVELQEYKRRINSKAENFGWVKKEAGIVHIPLNRAKTLIEERGLPVASEEITKQVERAEQMRKRVLSAGSSAGRVIGAQ